jgi:hypothetical protein
LVNKWLLFNAKRAIWRTWYFHKEDILTNHKSFMWSLNIPINEDNWELSTSYCIPKFRKNQYIDRYIPGSSTCSTKELSITMTKILHAVNGGLLSYCDKVYLRGSINHNHRIGDVMVSVLAGQTKDYTIDICCFSAKHAELQRKSKDWLARNQNNVSEWSDMSTRGLFFRWVSAIKIQLSVLV